MPLDILKSVQLSYDYDQIPAAERTAVVQAAMEIKPRLKRAAQDVYAIGEQLNTVKDLIPHGQWADWLNVEFELTDRTARNFMAVADRFAGKTEIISDLPPTALYLLAAPSTPDTVVEDVTAKAAAGERVRVADVKQAISAAKPTASVDDLTRHIGSWLSKQEGNAIHILSATVDRSRPTRKELEAFLRRRDVTFAVLTLEEAIAEVLTNLHNTVGESATVTGPMPTMTHKDVEDLKARQARPELPTVNSEPKPLVDWTQEDWANYRAWNDQKSPAPPTDNTSLSVDPQTAPQSMSKSLSMPSYGDDFAEWINDGWKILMPGGKWQAVNHQEQLATAIVSNSEILLNLMRLRKWSSENYFIDEKPAKQLETSVAAALRISVNLQSAIQSLSFSHDSARRINNPRLAHAIERAYSAAQDAHRIAKEVAS